MQEPVAPPAISRLPPPWQRVLADECDKPYFTELMQFVAAERVRHEVYPPAEDVFRALELCAYEDTHVLLVGQDPYHDAGQAHGLCFSVRPGVKPPRSLVNIFKELNADLGIPIPRTGHLEPWARQGILMLNASLTVRAHEANSHKGRGWEAFTDAIIRKLNEREDTVVFVLWGGSAQKKLKLIDTDRHAVVKGAHPSPLSARQWFGSRPFTQINRALRAAGKAEIDWRL